MRDEQIVELYWRREERALEETDRKYGRYCHTVAYNILHNHEDSEECVSDTWLRSWNSMPPQKPSKLQLFLAKITRNLAFDRFKHNTAKKRGAGEMMLVLDELESCIPAPGNLEEEIIGQELAESVNRFVRALPEREGNIFARRYFFTESVEQIASRYALTENNTAVILSRVRQKLKAHLTKEGYTL